MLALHSVTMVAHYSMFAKTIQLSLINHAANAKCRILAVFWITCCISMIGITVYQIVKFANQFNDSPILVSVSIKSHPTKPFPAVTVCNMNPYRRSAVENMTEFQSLFQAFAMTQKNDVRPKRSDAMNLKDENTMHRRLQREEQLCPVGFSSDTNYQHICYFSNNATHLQTWNVGRNVCQSLGADLPVFYDMSEYLSYIKWWTKNQYLPCQRNSWLGLSNDNANGSWLWIDGSQATFNLFDMVNMNNATPHVAAHAFSGSLWNTGYTNTSNASLMCQLRLNKTVNPTILSWPNSTKCPSQGTWYYDTNSDICYFVEKQQYYVNWSYTSSFCSASGSSLPYYLSNIEYTSYQNLIQTLLVPCGSSATMWLGYTKSNGTFQDINGSTNFFNWASGYPYLDYNSTNSTVVFTNVWNDENSWKNVSPDDGIGPKMTHIVCQFRPEKQNLATTSSNIFTTTRTDSSPASTTNFQSMTTIEDSSLTAMFQSTLLESTTTAENILVTAAATVTTTTQKSLTAQNIMNLLYLDNNTDPISRATNFQSMTTIEDSSLTAMFQSTLLESTTTAENILVTTAATVTTTTQKSLTAQKIMKLLYLDNNTDPISRATTIQEAIPYIAAQMSTSVRMQLGYSLDSVFLHCSFNRNRCGTQDFVTWNQPSIGNCFTFNHANGNQQITEHGGSEYGLNLIFNSSQDEYLKSSITSGYLVFVNYNKETIFPDIKSFVVSPGYMLDVSLDYVFMKRIGEDTGECVSDKFDTDDIFYDGEYSTLGCLKTCYQKTVISTCGCGDPNYPLPPVIPEQYEACSMDKKSCVDSVANTTLTNMDNCSCKQQCYEHVYRATPTLTKMRKISQFGQNQNLVSINVYHQAMSYFLLQEFPSYDIGQFYNDFSNIVGFNMEIAFHSIFEIVALLFFILSAIVTI